MDGQHCQQFFQLYSSQDKIKTSKTKIMKEPVIDIHNTNQLISQKSKLIFETENITSLHDKLYREADKIRKWKIQTELELQNKEKKLHDASLRIEAMKKSVLEFQLLNQRAISKLQEEVKSKEEVLERVNSTRELCNLLKNHASKLQERLNHFEDAKMELQDIEKECRDNFEILNSEFKHLQINAQETKQKLESQVKVLKQENDQREHELLRKLTASELEKQRLNGEVEETNNSIHQMKTLLVEKDCKLQELNTSMDTLHLKVNGLLKTLEYKEDELNKSSQTLSKIQEDKCNIENVMKTLEKDVQTLQTRNNILAVEMHESNERLEKQLEKVNEELHATQEILEKKQKQLFECEEKLTETAAKLEKLSQANDALVQEKINSEMHLDMQDFQMNNLKAMNEENKEEIHILNGEISVLNAKLDRENLCRNKMQDELDLMQLKISEMLLEREEHLKNIEIISAELKLAQETNISLETIVSEKENKIITLEHSSEKLDQMIAEQSSQILNLEGHMSECRKKILASEEDLCNKVQEIKELTSTIQELKSSKLKQDKELKAYALKLETFLCEESQQSTDIQNLTLLVAELSDKKLENEKSLVIQQSKVNTCIKQNKELEKEVKNLKSKLELEEKVNVEKEQKIIILQHDLNILVEKKETLERLNVAYKQEQEASIIALKKAEEKVDAALKENECQMTAMMATLDNYRQSSQILIVDKDKEIQTLKIKLHNSEVLAQEREKALVELKQETAQKRIEKITKKLTNEAPVKSEDSKNADVEAGKVCLTKIKTAENAEKHNHFSSQLSETVMTPQLGVNLLSAIQKTPQRGILRNTNPISKRRKVAFTPKDNSLSDDSDVVELDSQVFKPVKTPLRPNCFSKEELLKTPDRLLQTPNQASSNRTVKNVDAQYTLDETNKLNVRKTPMRKTSKFFTTSPKNKAAIAKMNQNGKSKSENTEQLAWFELDSVYGFVCED